MYGVLVFFLYALLCGTLPFDDENIASMYAKIQVISR